ncbi:hypothetical protein Tco_0015961, partial [Tanacetum coccineum]
MTSEDWAEYDAYLLKRLGDVVKRGDLSMGTRYTERFYEEFAPKLAAVTGQEITAQDVIDRVHRLREIYHDCKADGVFHHDVMKSDEFCYRMKRCFGLTYGKKPRIPRSRLSSLHTWNVGSGSGAGSGSGSGSVSSASVSNEPTSLEKALARLHTRNRARLDGHRCLLFTRLLERDPQVSKLFLALKTPEEKLNFIDDQKLERFDFQRAAAVGDGGLACGGRGTGLHCLPISDVHNSEKPLILLDDIHHLINSETAIGRNSRITDDLRVFSGEEESARYTKFFDEKKIAECRRFMEQQRFAAVASVEYIRDLTTIIEDLRG